MAVDLTEFRKQYPDLPPDVPDDVLLSALYEKFYYRAGVDYKDFEAAVQKKYGVEEKMIAGQPLSKLKAFGKPGVLRAPRLGQAVFGEPPDVKYKDLPEGEHLMRLLENFGRGVLSLPDVPLMIAKGLKQAPWETVKTIAMFPPEQMNLALKGIAGIPEAQEAIGEDPASVVFGFLMFMPGFRAIGKKMRPPEVSIYEAPVADITAAFERIEKMTSEIKTLAGKTFVEERPIGVLSPKPQIKNAEVSKLWDEVFDELPDYIKKDIDVKSVRIGEFGEEYAGEGGRLIRGGIGHKGELHIVLEKGEPALKEGLKHEIIHAYVERHPELTTAKSPFVFENAVDKVLRELKEPPKPLVSKLRPRKKATESLKQHHKIPRGVDFIANELKRFGEESVPDKARQKIIRNYTEQPKLFRSQLTPEELKIADFARSQRNEVTAFIQKYKVLQPGTRPPGVDYLYHWWKDPETGIPFNPHYGKFSQSLPQAEYRKITTYPEGEAMGLEAVSTNVFEIIGVTWKSVIRAQQSRQMFKSLRKIEAGTGAVIRMQEGEPRPSRIIENWDTVRRRGEPSEYVEYKDWPGIGAKTVVGIHKSAWPHIKAYFESPSYGSLAKSVFVTKAVKLGMSMFHPAALGVQAVTAGFEPISLTIKGHRLVKQGGATMQLLYRNGLPLHEYADVGLDYLRSSNKLIDIGLAPIRASANFIFKILHTGLRAGHGWIMYNKLLPEYLAKGLTKDQCARDVVLMGDRLFSGEDYKQTMLEGGEFMAKYWYSPSARKGLQMALISPMWQKAHGIMAGATIKSFIPNKIRRKIGLSESRPIDKAYRAYFGRAMGIYMQANLWNWIWTKELDGEGRLMWQNKQPFSIRAPYNEPDGHKAYWRPLKSIFEVPEFLPRPGHWLGAPLTKIGHKLTPVWQAAASQLWNFSYTGKRYEDEGIANIAERAMDVFGDVLTPISVGQLGLGELITDPEGALKRKGFQSRIVGAIGIPPSRGMTTYDAVPLFEKAYKAKDREEINRIKQELKDNGYSVAVIKRTYNRARNNVYRERNKPENLIQKIIGK